MADGRIVDVGRFPLPEGVPCVDAAGCYVTPGFIDIHSHSDFTLVVDPRAVSSVTQGVTLEVVGNCGHGCAPIVDPERARANIYGCRTGHEIQWRTVGEYLDVLEARRPAVNVVTLVPNGNLRLAVCDSVDRPSTPDELARMKRTAGAGDGGGRRGVFHGSGIRHRAGLSRERDRRPVCGRGGIRRDLRNPYPQPDGRGGGDCRGGDPYRRNGRRAPPDFPYFIRRAASGRRRMGGRSGSRTGRPCAQQRPGRAVRHAHAAFRDNQFERRAAVVGAGRT